MASWKSYVGGDAAIVHRLGTILCYAELHGARRVHETAAVVFPPGGTFTEPWNVFLTFHTFVTGNRTDRPVTRERATVDIFMSSQVKHYIIYFFFKLKLPITG